MDSYESTWLARQTFELSHAHEAKLDRIESMIDEALAMIFSSSSSSVASTNPLTLHRLRRASALHSHPANVIPAKQAAVEIAGGLNCIFQSDDGTSEGVCTAISRTLAVVISIPNNGRRLDDDDDKDKDDDDDDNDDAREVEAMLRTKW